MISDTMDRKSFLAILATAPGACCGLAAQAPQGTPCEKKYAFAQMWVKRLMGVLDNDFDQPTRTRLLEAMGHGCYRSGHPQREEKPDLDKTLAALAKYTGQDNVRRAGNIIDINLNNKVCLCPLTEQGPEGLSGTYCTCSTGYMQAMFEPFGGTPKVDLLESVKRGGKSCRFRVTLGKA